MAVAGNEVVIQRFRNLLEANGLAKDLIERINTILAQNGVQILRGRIVGLTITREHFSAEYVQLCALQG